jgi:hypothetical protein
MMNTVRGLTAILPLTLNGQALYAGPAWTLVGILFLCAVGSAWMARGRRSAVSA